MIRPLKLQEMSVFDHVTKLVRCLKARARGWLSPHDKLILVLILPKILQNTIDLQPNIAVLLIFEYEVAGISRQSILIDVPLLLFSSVSYDCF